MFLVVSRSKMLIEVVLAGMIPQMAAAKLALIFILWRATIESGPIIRMPMTLDPLLWMREYSVDTFS